MTSKGREFPPDLLGVARRVMWFTPPGKTLSDRRRFLCYLMDHGTIRDILVARRYYSDDDFKDALDHAYAGSIDRKSWSYWNLVLNGDASRRYPDRPLA